ncbi:hypothetical protein CMV_003940 [Castanea mollissima]|uniref:Uncharacterized protein n=1 Tax=Castanea mollissima TaxID=60419 RepID=A0A8J4RGI2_9ROSI|nr:hypothetical protein CMV_003940 [Castanea mollissima]
MKCFLSKVLDLKIKLPYGSHSDIDAKQSDVLISNYNSSSKNGPAIVIEGTTAVEIASGLYWYLKYWCGAHVSWDKTGGVQIASIPKPGSLPLVKDDGVMIQRPVPWNYYQNVVTSSYSYVWWDWERWEKEIDGCKFTIRYLTFQLLKFTIIAVYRSSAENQLCWVLKYWSNHLYYNPTKTTFLLHSIFLIRVLHLTQHLF